MTGAVTGVGSMPGTSSAEAARIIAGELGGLPHIAELPARGAGADMIGRTGGMLAGVSAGLGLEAVPTGWRLVGSLTRDMRRARSWLSEDLDRLQEAVGDHGGPVKVQVAGPWTMAAAVEQRAGERALSDEGLVREMAAALAAAVGAHAAEVQRRLPQRHVIVQLDEPMLPRVLAGGLTTASGWSAHLPRAEATVLSLLEPVARAAPGRTILHCCGEFPFSVMRRSGIAGISVDIMRLSGEGPEHALAELLEADLTLYAGVIPSAPQPSGDPQRTVRGLSDAGLDRLERLWSRTGLARERLADVVVTPTCGLAGAGNQARTALDAAGEVARRLAFDR